MLLLLLQLIVVIMMMMMMIMVPILLNIYLHYSSTMHSKLKKHFIIFTEVAINMRLSLLQHEMVFDTKMERI